MDGAARYIKAPDQDVALSCRVRLFRDFRDMPYAGKLSGGFIDEAERRVCDVMLARGQDGVYTLLRLRDMNEDARGRLLEHELVDEASIRRWERSSVLISSGSTISVMIASDDHVTVQGLLPGMNIERAAQLAFEAEERIGREYAFAFDSEIGFLTASPLLAGTGMRAEVLLHIPAIVRGGKLGEVLQEAGKASLTFKNAGGTREPVGHLFRLSNQATLGRSEEDILLSLRATADSIIARERAMREQAEKTDMMKLQDMLMRSWGEALNARLMSSRDHLRCWSDIRYAAAMGYVHMPLAFADELLYDLGPNSIQADTGRILGERELEILRAAIMREKLPEAANHYTE